MTRASLLAAIVLLSAPALRAAPVAVLRVEGTAHGFLVLRNAAGTALADGELVQVERDGAIETRLSFRFHDGSRSEETAVFTQDAAFRLVRYDLRQSGPAFPRELTATLDARSGRCTVRARDRGERDDATYDDVLKLPADTSNGLVPILVRNLPRGGSLHMVAFTPKPTIVEVAVAPPAEREATLGAGTLPVAHYVLTPRLGAFKRAIAKLLGKLPPDTHVWLTRDEAPAFLRFEGSLAIGLPAWRIESALPALGD